MAGIFYYPTVNGKESQKFAGLPYLDYGARFYHQLSSRWTTMDPLAEKYYSVSPYAFCSGNPVNFAIKREQNELAHFAEREQRKALQGLNFVDWDGKLPDAIWDIANIVLGVQSLTSNIKEGNVLASVVDGVGLVVDIGATLLPGIPGGASTGIKALRGGEKAVDAVKALDKASDVAKSSDALKSAGDIVDAGKHGSYTVTFESGNRYHGKGSTSRMEQSAREKTKKYDDSVVSKDWTPAASEKEAFMDEARRIRSEKGFGPEYGNYNKINSPGEKFLKEIGE